MSELAAHYEESTLEPDENTLINALRNQDDIPILMDVVTDKEDVDVSDDELAQLADTPPQPMGLAELVAEDLREDQDADHEEESRQAADTDQEDDHSDIPVLTTPEVAAGSSPAQQSASQNESAHQKSQQTAGEQSELQEAISIALAEVLQRRLPELVEEVLHIVNERVSNSK